VVVVAAGWVDVVVVVPLPEVLAGAVVEVVVVVAPAGGFDLGGAVDAGFEGVGIFTDGLTSLVRR
jgi:hypothetical protein